MRRAAVPVSEIAGSAGATPRSAKKQISQNPAIRTSAASEASRSLNGASGFPENPSRNTPQIDLVAALQVSQNADKSKLACNPDQGALKRSTLRAIGNSTSDSPARLISAIPAISRGPMTSLVNQAAVMVATLISVMNKSPDVPGFS